MTNESNITRDTSPTNARYSAPPPRKPSGGSPCGGFFSHISFPAASRKRARSRKSQTPPSRGLYHFRLDIERGGAHSARARRAAPSLVNESCLFMENRNYHNKGYKSREKNAGKAPFDVTLRARPVPGGFFPPINRGSIFPGTWPSVRYYRKKQAWINHTRSW